MELGLLQRKHTISFDSGNIQWVYMIGIKMYPKHTY